MFKVIILKESNKPVGFFDHLPKTTLPQALAAEIQKHLATKQNFQKQLLKQQPPP
jgi:transposase-like protein